MDAASYARRMAERLPTVLREGKNLGLLLGALGGEFSHMERATTLLMRARWFDLALGWEMPPEVRLPDDWDDLSEEARAAALPDPLASVYGIVPLDGESANAFRKRIDLAIRTRQAKSDLGRIGGLYGLQPEADESPKRYRDRLSAFVAIHRSGLCTAGAIIHLAALVYRVEGLPEIAWEDGVAVGTFRARDAAGRLQDVRIEVQDHPGRWREEVKEIGPQGTLEVVNEGLHPAIPEIDVTAVGGTAVMPLLSLDSAGVEVVAYGQVAKRSKLALRHGKTPLLDGVRVDLPGFRQADVYPVDAQSVVTLQGDRFLAPPGGAGSRVVFYIRESPFKPIKSARFVRVHRDYSLPVLPPGKSVWRYAGITAQNLDSYLSFIGEADRAPLRELYAGATEMPVVRLAIRWREAAPATFTLRIPSTFLPPRLPNLAALAGRLQVVLDYTRAAGIESRLELFMPVWHEAMLAAERLVDPVVVSLHQRADHKIAAELEPTVAVHPVETQVVQEQFGVTGIFDNGYFDLATFEQPGSDGVIEDSYFDAARFDTHDEETPS